MRIVIDNGNVFAVLVDAVRCCSLGQITNALFEVGAVSEECVNLRLSPRLVPTYSRLLAESLAQCSRP